MMTWRDQVALVTGSARGIGRATARLLANCGAAVCVNYTVHAEAAEGLAAEIIATGGRAIVAMADVAEAAAVEAMVARAEKELGNRCWRPDTAVIPFPQYSVLLHSETTHSIRICNPITGRASPMPRDPQHHLCTFRIRLGRSDHLLVQHERNPSPTRRSVHRPRASMVGKGVSRVERGTNSEVCIFL